MALPLFPPHQPPSVNTLAVVKTDPFGHVYVALLVCSLDDAPPVIWPTRVLSVEAKDLFH